MDQIPTQPTGQRRTSSLSDGTRPNTIFVVPVPSLSWEVGHHNDRHPPLSLPPLGASPANPPWLGRVGLSGRQRAVVTVTERRVAAGRPRVAPRMNSPKGVGG